MLFDTITKFSQKHNLLPKGSHIILGLSGGPDSIFLLHYLTSLHKKNEIALTAAHLDHEWRDGSNEDAKFCRSATEALGVPLVTGTTSQFSSTFKFDGSREKFARQVRRHFLEQVAQEHNATHIALAHHAQDQQETFFIRLIRGASLSGICAMRPQRGIYVRPLLHTNKSEILTYLNAHNILYLDDPSNQSSDFLRNRIRHTVLPALHTADPRFEKSFLSSLGHLQQTEQFLEEITQKTFEAVSFVKNNKLFVDITKLLNQHLVMRHRLLIHWLCLEQVSFPPVQSFLDEILRFLSQKQSKNHAIHKTWSLVKEKDCVYIRK